MEFVFEFPDALYAELIDAAEERRCTPKTFAEEILSVALAERRLPRVIGVEALQRAPYLGNDHD